VGPELATHVRVEEIASEEPAAPAARGGKRKREAGEGGSKE
jgi:hypothetical protein